MIPSQDKCPACGATLAGGLCRQCLLRVGLGATPTPKSARPAPITTGSLHPPPFERSGDTIDRYKLLQQIGEGGCGVVYLAEQSEPIRREVALKVIKLGMDTKCVIARFDAERQALAMMDHPNIAKVLDAGATAAGRPYFVMELVRGLPITKYCDDHNLPAPQRLDLFIAVCHAIQHAHQKGIIHRDIKPSNILVTLQDGVPAPKVIDFGIAKAIEARLTDLTLLTELHAFIGTPDYTSPEQAEMSGLDIDTRADIYSLGVLLYELLSGRLPFDREKLLRAGLDEMRRTIREVEPPRPSTRLSILTNAERTAIAMQRGIEPGQLASLLRGDLDWIVMKAIEKNRTRRYETANAFAEDILRHRTNLPVFARPASWIYVLRRLVKRHKLPFAAGAGVAVAVLLALVILLLSNARIRSETNQKDVALREKDAALARVRASAQAAREQLFLALFNRARAGRFSGQMGQRIDSLQALAEAARIRPEDRLRDEATAAMALPDVHPGPSWHLDADEVVDASYRFSAGADAAGLITVRSVPDHRELGQIESGEKTSRLVFSKDGRLLAQYTPAGEWKIWRWSDAHSVLGNVGRCGEAIAFSPDNRHVAFAQADSILIVALDTGLEENRWRTSGPAHDLAFHPDSRRIAVGFARSAVTSVYDIADGHNVVDLQVGPLLHQVVAWHPDGIRLAVASFTPPIQIWNVETKIKVAALEGNAQQVDRLGFHPDGEMLASEGWEGVCRIWQPSSARLLMQFQSPAPFSFSPDGRRLGGFLTGDQERVLEVASCPEYRTFWTNRGAGLGTCSDGDISPDGRLFALGMDDGVRLWSLSDRRELAFLPIGYTNSAIFQPDGSELLTCGNGGLQRWSLKMDVEDSSVIRLGPPIDIALPFIPSRAARSQDGNTLAVISKIGGGAMSVDLRSGLIRSRFMPHPEGLFVALSPDGQWMASSGWHSDRVRLWNASDGALVHEWILGTMTAVAFSGDGKTLFVARRDGVSFLDVASFEVIRRLHGEVELTAPQMASSPDGKLLALALTPTVIYLLDASTGRTVARLEDPHGDRTTWISFTPDGTQVISVANFARAIHIWDLRAIRTRLKGMGLDWEWPEFPSANEKNAAASLAGNPIRRIEVAPLEE